MPAGRRAGGRCGGRLYNRLVKSPPLIPFRPAAALLAAALAARAVADGDADWPQFRGDARLTGVAGCVLPEKLARQWQFKAADAIESTAAIVGDTAYVGADDGRFYALRLTDGTPRWTYDAGNPVKSSPTVHEGRVYFGDDGGVLHAVEAATGARRWRFDTGAGTGGGAEIVSSPVQHGGRLYFGGYDGFVRCVDLDGKPVWQYQTAGKVHATPAIVEDRVLVSGCDGYLRGLSLGDGKEVGKVALGDYCGASPAGSDDRVYVGTFGERVVAIDWRAGRELWSYSHPTRHFPYLSSAAVTEDLVVLGGRDRIVRGLERSTGKPRWELMTRSRVDGSPVVSGPRAWVGGGDGVLYGIDLKSGEVVWRYEGGGPFFASPAVGRERLVIGDGDGVVYCFGATREAAREGQGRGATPESRP